MIHLPAKEADPGGQFFIGVTSSVAREMLAPCSSGRWPSA